MILIRKLTARAESFPSRCGSTNTGEGRALYPAVCCAVRLLSVENSGPSGSGRGRSCPSPRRSACTMAARAPPGSTCCPCPSQFAPKAVQTRPLCRSKFCFQRAGNVTPAGRGKRSRAEAPAERAGGALAPPDRPARCWPARVRASSPRGGPRGPLRGPLGAVHVPEPGAHGDTAVHIRRFEDSGGTFAARSAAGEGLGTSRPSKGYEERSPSRPS